MASKGQNTRDKAIKNLRTYAIPILEKQQVKTLLKHSEHYSEFWDKYCVAFKLNKSDLFASDKQKKKAAQWLRQLKCDHTNLIADASHINDNHVVVLTKRKRSAAHSTSRRV